MPDIQPTPGDKIVISVVTYTGGPPTFSSAQIKTKGTDGKWEVELAGDPPMRGKIDINQYEWDAKFLQWKRKDTPVVVEATAAE